MVEREGFFFEFVKIQYKFYFLIVFFLQIENFAFGKVVLCFIIYSIVIAPQFHF